MTGGSQNGAEKRELLAALRRQIRALEQEVGAVADVETSSGSTEPRTLAAREQLLTEAERIAQVGSWALHVSSNSVHWSDELFRIMGVDPDDHGELVETFYQRIHPDDRSKLLAEHGQLQSKGSFPPVEFRVVRPDGSERQMRGQGSAVLDADGTPVRFVGTVHDITELREAEQGRLRDHEMLRAAEALANIGSFRWVPSTMEIVWSAQFRAIVGVSPETVPTFDGFTARLHPEDKAKLEKLTAWALQTGRTHSPLEVRLTRDDGSVRNLILAGRFLPGGEMLGSVLDVTERRQLESDLFQSQKLEALGRLAGGIAHDFNNILAVLKLGTESRNGGAEMLAELSTAIDRGAALTRQLLAFSRKNVLEPRPVDVGELLHQSVTLVERLLGDSVSVRLDRSAEGLTVNADPTQLQHTLINLMVNARDAMPHGGTISLSAQALRFDSSPPGVSPQLVPGRYVAIEVRDEGTGIDAAALPHIFEPFFTTKPEGHGTGLGLASVFGTVSQSGGGLKVRSQPGAGSTFQIYLPQSDRVPERTRSAVARAQRAGRGERILVLDDLPAIRRVLAIILQSAGFEPVVISDVPGLVADAPAIAASCRAVITDLDMPGYSGPEIARVLWRHAPALPVLFMSGHPVLELPSGNGAPTAFLGKPFSADEVLAQLTTLISPKLAMH